MIKAASDPMAMIQQMAMTDPRMQQVSETIRQNGGVQQAVYNLAKQKGLDPNAVLQQARQFAQQIK